MDTHSLCNHAVHYRQVRCGSIIVWMRNRGWQRSLGRVTHCQCAPRYLAGTLRVALAEKVNIGNESPKLNPSSMAHGWPNFLWTGFLSAHTTNHTAQGRFKLESTKNMADVCHGSWRRLVAASQAVRRMPLAAALVFLALGWVPCWGQHPSLAKKTLV